jgi:hypothetical protein
VNKNTEGKHDGAEFEREAVAYAAHHNTLGHETIMVPVPCQLPAPRRPAAVENTVTQVFQRHSRQPFHVCAYFGHAYLSLNSNGDV